MAKVILAKTINKCDDCPMRISGGPVEDQYATSNMKYIYDYKVDSPFPAWCPLEDKND